MIGKLNEVVDPATRLLAQMIAALRITFDGTRKL